MVRTKIGYAALVCAVLTASACGTQYDKQRPSGEYSDLQKLVVEQRRAIDEMRREQETLRGAVEEIQYRMGPAGQPIPHSAPSYSNQPGYAAPSSAYPAGAGMPPYGTAAPVGGDGMPAGMAVPGGVPADGAMAGGYPTGNSTAPAGDVAGGLWSGGVAPPAGGEFPAAAGVAPVAGLPQTAAIPAGPSVTAVPVAPWTAGQVPSVPVTLTGSVYEQGVRGLIAGEYDLAIQDMRTFIHENGTSSYADDAQYWIGESYFRKGQFPRAIIEFNQVSMTYGTGDRAAAALVREAEAFQMMGDRVDARLSLQKVISRYPGSDEAARASRMLGDIGG